MPDCQPVQEVHTLASDGYHSFLSSGLHELYQQDTLCDITIQVGHKTFRAHKAILSVAMPYFRSMCTSGFQETSSSEAIIEGDSAAFESLLRFAYTGNLSLSEDTVREILGMASYMQFDKALQLCEKYIVQTTEDKSLSFETACDLLPLAAGHALQDIAGVLRKYLMKNVMEFSKTSLFLDLQAVDVILDCFRNSEAMANVECPEDQILTIMLHWMRHDWDTRKDYAESLLKHIRLCLLPVERLKELLDEVPGCDTLLTEALQLIGSSKGVNPLTLARRYPSLYAPRGLTTTLMLASSHAAYYDTTKRCWVPFSFEPPTFRSHLDHTVKHAMIVVGDELYAAGGLAQPVYNVSNNFCKYNSATNTWDALERMNEARSVCALVELDGYIYAISNTQRSVERYNIATGKWSNPGEVSPMLMGVGNVSAVAFNGNILVFGVDFPSVVQIYIPSTNTWHEEMYILTMPDDDLENVSEDFPPVLKVHKGNCYLVFSLHTLDVDEGTLLRNLHVVKLDINFDAAGLPTFVFETQSQDPLAGNKYCAFVIEEDVFVIAGGCVHNTGIKVLDRKNKIDLGVWKGVFDEFIQALKEYAVVYSFDKFRLYNESD